MTTDRAGWVDRWAEGATERLLSVGIDGIGPFRSAEKVAAAAVAEHPSIETAIENLIDDHARFAAMNGFITGLGGLTTMAIALPINVAVFSVLSARMTASIYAVRGGNLEDPLVRTSVLLALSSGDATELLSRVGISAPGGKVARAALDQLPAQTLTFLNKGLIFRFLASTLGKGVARFGRLVPLAGGIVGAVIDRTLITTIADHARRESTAPPS